MQRFKLPVAVRAFSFYSSRFECNQFDSLTQTQSAKNKNGGKEEQTRFSHHWVNREILGNAIANFIVEMDFAWFTRHELNERRLPRSGRFWQHRAEEKTFHLPPDTYSCDYCKPVAIGRHSCRNPSDRTLRFYQNIRHSCGSHLQNEHQLHPIFGSVHSLRKMAMPDPDLQTTNLDHESSRYRVNPVAIETERRHTCNALQFSAIRFEHSIAHKTNEMCTQTETDAMHFIRTKRGCMQFLEFH